jgi:hypothetical protein
VLRIHSRAWRASTIDIIYIKVRIIIAAFNAVKIVKPSQAMKHVFLIKMYRRLVVWYHMQIHCSTSWDARCIVYHLPHQCRCCNQQTETSKDPWTHATCNSPCHSILCYNSAHQHTQELPRYYLLPKCLDCWQVQNKQLYDYHRRVPLWIKLNNHFLWLCHMSLPNQQNTM